MKASICVLAAALLAAPAGAVLAAPAKAPTHSTAKPVKAASGQTYASGRCRVTIPKSWTDHRGGKADPADRDFNVTLGRAGDPKAMASMVKAMGGRLLSDEPGLTLMQVGVRGRGAKQYWSLTKPGPGCRATVTYSDSDQEAAAKKIAQSLKKAS